MDERRGGLLRWEEKEKRNGAGREGWWWGGVSSGIRHCWSIFAAHSMYTIEGTGSVKCNAVRTTLTFPLSLAHNWN